MAATIRGIQPLAWGTTAITGYVTESQGDDLTSEDLEIDDEDGQIVTHVSGFGGKVDVTLEVIPKATGATPPDEGEVFTYGSSKLVVLGLSRKRVKKDVEKWTIKGKRHRGISLS